MSKLREKGYFIVSISLAILIGFSVILFFVSNNMAANKSTNLTLIDDLDWLVPLGKYDYLSNFESRPDLLIYGQDNHYGIIDKKDKLIAPTIYNYISPYGKEDYILCETLGKSGYLDKSGKVVIPLIYDLAYDFCGDYALVKQDLKYKVINKAGDVIFDNPENYQMYPTEKEAYFSFWLEGDFDDSFKGLIDVSSGQIVIKPTMYKGAFQYAEGFWLTEAEPHISLRIPVFLSDDSYEEVFTDKILHIAMPFSEGLAAVTTFVDEVDVVRRENLHIGESGYMDYSGKMLTNDATFSARSPYKEGLASGHDHKGIYYIDKSGQIVFQIPRSGNFLYSKESFSEGYACVKVDKFWAYVDKEGRFLVSPIFHDAFPVTGNVAVVIYSGKYGAFEVK